jgi:hypothetical protein
VENEMPEAWRPCGGFIPNRKGLHHRDHGLRSGKSTLTDKITKELRKKDLPWDHADPTSPSPAGHSWGPLRMQDITKR